MRKRAMRTGVDGLSPSLEIPFNRGSVFGFEDGEGGAQEFTPWNNDDVDAWRDSTATKDLSD
jgi:hypothetical protein